MILPASYQSGFAPRDGRPLYPELWRGCVGAWVPCLGPTGLTLRDWSGRRNHGTLTNMDARTDWVASQGRYALDFDGSNDYVSLATNITVYPFSVSAWWYPTDMTVFSTIFAISAATGADRRWTMEMRNNTESNFLALTAQSAPTYSQTNSTASCVVNTWQHCVAVFTSATSRTIYLRGGNSATGTTSVTPAGIDTTAIGRLVNGTSPSGVNYAKGQIDDVMLFDRPLTANEIRLLSSRRGIAYEMAPRRRSSSAVQFNRRRRLLLGASN